MEKIITDSFPNDTQLDQLERVWIVDDATPESPIGLGEMPVLAVGETENAYTERTAPDGRKYRGGGDFSPRAVSGSTEMKAFFGRLGHDKAEGRSRGPVAVRSCGDTLWNGNLHCHLAGFTYPRLIIARVDNSAGIVTFARHAHLVFGVGPFQATHSSTTTLQRNGVTDVVATWLGVKATITGVGGTYPTNFVGGETLILKVDKRSTKVITFTEAEQLLADVETYIDKKLAADVAGQDGGELTLSGIIEGKDSRIEIIGGSALSTLGLVATPVADTWTYTIAVAAAGVYTVTVSYYVDGVLTDYVGTYTADGLDTVTTIRDGIRTNILLTLPSDIDPVVSGGDAIVFTGAANIDIITVAKTAEPNPADTTVLDNDTGLYSVQVGTGNVGDLLDIQVEEASTIFAALADIESYVDSIGRGVVANGVAGGTLQATAGLVEEFGFDPDEIANAAIGVKTLIPTGTRVYDAVADTYWCTIEDYETDLTGGGFDIRVRPWYDDDTANSSAIGDVDMLVDMPAGYWSVSNAAAIVRLSEPQMDVRYKQALERSLDVNSQANQARIVISARSSEKINDFLHANALASTTGVLYPRRAIVSPPVGTAKLDATGDDAIGVGNGRGKRRMYVFPAIRKYVPEIAEATSLAGLGFTDNGIIETTANFLYAMIRSKLASELSAGELPTSNDIGALNLYGVAGLESLYNSELGGISLEGADYVTFKQKGIIALNKIPTVGYSFQSDVTSVDPTVTPQHVSASRGFIFDEVATTLWRMAIPYKDKLTSTTNINAMLSNGKGYMKRLESADNPDRARIRKGTFDLASSEQNLADGFVIFRVGVQVFSHIKAVVFDLKMSSSSIVITEVA